MSLDPEVYKQGMLMLCEVVRREPSELLLDAYYAALKVLTEDQFRTAMGRVLVTRKISTLPLPAEILELVVGKVEDEAIIALDKLERATATHGAYRTMIFDDPIIHAIVQSMGGWPKVCRWPEDEWKFRRQEFRKVYAAFAPNLHRLEIPVKLLGADESASSPVAKIVYVGDPQKIDAWQSQIKTIDHKPQSTGDVLKKLGMVQ